MVEQSTKRPMQLAYCYLALPVIIFFLGWLKLWLAIPATILLLLALFFAMRNAPAVWKPEWRGEALLKMALILIVVFIWVYFSGIGGMVYQNTDHLWRNSVFQCLVEEEWPPVWNAVQYPDVGPNAQLCYYIGFWLPSAIVGKLTNLATGYRFQIIWAVAGIMLCYYLICASRKKLVLWPLIVFVFFSGLDILGMLLSRGTLEWVVPVTHLEAWNPLQYSGTTVQLFWVFNQAVPAWLCCMVLYLQTDNRYLVFLASLVLLAAPLPFVGLLPFILYFAIRNGRNNQETFGRWLKNIFTWENVAAGGVIGITIFLFMTSNASVQKSGSNSWRLIYGARYEFFRYIMLILFDGCLYLLLIARRQMRSPMFYITGALLIVVPFIFIGQGTDFCMRGSIPALFFLYIMVVDSLEGSLQKKDLMTFIPLLLLLLIGAVSPLCEFIRAAANTWNGAPDCETAAQLGENFHGSAESFFFRVLCRR